MLLRKYLYIDEDFVNDAFATINGYDYDHKDIKKDNATSVSDDSDSKAHKESAQKTDTLINANMPVTAKLQSIFDYLNQYSESGIPFYESMSNDDLVKCKREDFIEGVFNLNYTKIERYGLLSESAQKIDQLFDLHKTDGVIAIDKMQELAKQEREKGLRCILTFVNDKRSTAFAYLNEDSIKQNKRNLIGEVTILAKIIRTIKKGESICLTDITDFMEQTFPNTPKGKSDKIEAIKSGRMNKIKEFEDRINGPAIEIMPIAIYR